MKDWIYNEFNHVGADYSKKEITDVYDEQMESFRDYEKEVEDFLVHLNISNPQDLTVIDMGCGTGAFSIHASKYFKKIYAIDVSQEMLNIASFKASRLNIKNVEFCHSGFLQFQPGEEADIINTKWAFHHLPDYWKQAGLLNMNKMLKPGGILFLSDLVYRFTPDYEAKTEALLAELSKEFSKEFVDETKVHIRDEYSTFDWILEGMIERAGFSIEKSNTDNDLASEYFCRKIKSF
ncbi:MAG: methyltransferase domain-containing protein [Deltaproteobacteria bacterium]|nr:methyltransferase domain-containing protein [Deltaproteobacteria bacterium]